MARHGFHCTNQVKQKGRDNKVLVLRVQPDVVTESLTLCAGSLLHLVESVDWELIVFIEKKLNILAAVINYKQSRLNTCVVPLLLLLNPESLVPSKHVQGRYDRK